MLSIVYLWVNYNGIFLLDKPLEQQNLLRRHFGFISLLVDLQLSTVDKPGTLS